MHQISYIKQTRGHNGLVFGQPGAHHNTQTLFTNAVFVFSESAISEAVGMTMHYIDRCVNWTMLLSRLIIRNVTSTCGYQGKYMGVKIAYFL
jgi:hypothetical protein